MQRRSQSIVTVAFGSVQNTEALWLHLEAAVSALRHVVRGSPSDDDSTLHEGSRHPSCLLQQDSIELLCLTDEILIKNNLLTERF